MGRKAKLKQLRKEIRQQTGKALHEIKKDYKEHDVSTIIDAPTLEATEEGRYRIAGWEKRVVSKKIIENVNGAHKLYKVMKKMYDNPNYVPNLNALPSKEEEQNLMEEIINQEKQEESNNADQTSEEETNGKCNTKE